MRVSSLSVRFTKPVVPLKHTTDSSPHILRTDANITIHIRVTHETMHNLYRNNTMISTDIIKDISKIKLDRLVDSRDINHKDRKDTEKTRAIVMTLKLAKLVSIYRSMSTLE